MNVIFLGIGILIGACGMAARIHGKNLAKELEAERARNSPRP